MEGTAAVTGRQAPAADQFQDQAIGSGEIHRLRLPAAFQCEVVQPFRIALQRRACTQPAHGVGQAVVRHIEGKVHAAYRTAIRRLQLDRAPANADLVAGHLQLQHVAEVRGDAGNIGYRQGEMQQAHDRSSVER
ncbi:hypothetical protein D3C71_1303720 [compost metagenome]